MNPIPQELNHPRNRDVLTHLSDTSAHGDVAEALLDACASLGDFERFCPDPSEYRYLTVYTNATVFGFAMGMRTVGFRLAPVFKSRAIATGGEEVPGLQDWAAFQLFRSDWPAVDVKFWATRAYVWARESRDDGA